MAVVDKPLRTLLWTAAWMWAALFVLGSALVAGVAVAAPSEYQPDEAGLPAELQQQVLGLAQQAGARGAPGAPRVEVEVGRLDPRLRLAPCARIEPYLPVGSRPWGRTRVGLRCVEGAVRWNVFLPVTVKVFGRGLVAAAALPAGAVLSEQDLREAEVDLAAGGSPALDRPPLALGRTLARGLAAGEALRQADLRARQFFQAGDTVQLVALGRGIQVAGEARAMEPGLEGRRVRVRTDSGRVVTGVAAAQRRVEVPL